MSVHMCMRVSVCVRVVIVAVVFVSLVSAEAHVLCLKEDSRAKEEMLMFPFFCSTVSKFMTD